MLRLRVARRGSWIDSKGRVRSPFEELTLLDSELRADLAGRGDVDTVVWEFGVLTDDWDAPESSKPQEVGAEEDDKGTATCYAVGSDRAQELHEELEPLWHQFLTWLTDSHPACLFVSDEVWHPRGEWVQIDRAFEQQLFGGTSLSLAPTAAPRVYSVAQGSESVDQLVEVWWPSPLGLLGGVVGLRTTNDSVMSQVAQAGRVAQSDLPAVRQVFQTSPTFDNLGFVLLTQHTSWESIAADLATRGWTDGRPVDLIISAP